MNKIPLIWSLMTIKQQKTFIFLTFFSFIVLLLEILSIGSIFPIIYSIADPNFYKSIEFFNNFEFLKFKNNFNFSIFIFLSLIFIVIIKNLIIAIFFWYESKFLINTQETISKNLFSKLINKEYAFHLENNTADLITRVRTDSLLIREVISSLFKLLQSFIFIFGILLFLIFIEPLGFAITLSIFLFTGSIFYFLTSKKNKQIGELRQRLEIERTKKLQESFGGIKEIKTFIKDYLFVREYENLTMKIVRPYHLRIFISKLPRLFSEVLLVLIVVILVIFLYLNSFDNTKVFALLSVFGVSAIKIIPYLNNALNSLNTFKFSKDPIEYYNKFINFRSPTQNISTQKIINFNEKISLNDIYFRYPKNENYVLKKINFEINKKEKIIIQGETGSGKSTLIDLLLGLQAPTSGEIFFDEQKVNNSNHNWLINFSYIPQSIYLFDDTIKNNIILEHDESKFNANLFKNCLEICELSRFVDSLKNKENTNIGEIGSNISGGQKQRIGIARALYRNSKILILDEATNALDLETEKKIYSNISKIKDKTMIIVNHRDIFDKNDYKIINIQNNKLTNNV
tara:strand:+ start:10343 stop:12055 length:1713 start_codon:yes stop_codon:yes gene_type:complete